MENIWDYKPRWKNEEDVEITVKIKLPAEKKTAKINLEIDGAGRETKIGRMQTIDIITQKLAEVIKTCGIATIKQLKEREGDVVKWTEMLIPDELPKGMRLKIILT